MAGSRGVDRCKLCGRRNRRSNPANARYWLLLHLAASKLTPGGQTYSAEQFHIYYKTRFLGCDDFTLPNGKTVAIPKSSAELDVSEFNEYMTQVESDLADRDVFLEA